MSDLAAAAAVAFACVAVWKVARVGLFAVRHRAALRDVYRMGVESGYHPVNAVVLGTVALIIVTSWRGALSLGEDSAFSSVEP